MCNYPLFLQPLISLISALVDMVRLHKIDPYMRTTQHLMHMQPLWQNRCLQLQINIPIVTTLMG